MIGAVATLMPHSVCATPIVALFAGRACVCTEIWWQQHHLGPGQVNSDRRRQCVIWDAPISKYDACHGGDSGGPNEHRWEIERLDKIDTDLGQNSAHSSASECESQLQQPL